MVKYIRNCSDRYIHIVTDLKSGLSFSTDNLNDLGNYIYHASESIEIPLFLKFIDDTINTIDELDSDVIPDIISNDIESNFFLSLGSLINSYKFDKDRFKSRLEVLVTKLSDYPSPKNIYYSDLKIINELLSMSESVDKLFKIVVYLDNLFHENNSPTLSLSMFSDPEDSKNYDLGKFIYQSPIKINDKFIDLINLIEDNNESNSILVKIKDQWINYINDYGTTTHSDLVMIHLYEYQHKLFTPSLRSYVNHKSIYYKSMITKINNGDNPFSNDPDKMTFNTLASFQESLLPDEYMDELSELIIELHKTINDASQNLPSSGNIKVNFPTINGNITESMLVPDHKDHGLQVPKVTIEDAVNIINKNDSDNHNCAIIIENIYDNILDNINNNDCIDDLNDKLDEINKTTDDLNSNIDKIPEDTNPDDLDEIIDQIIPDIKDLINKVDEVLDPPSDQLDEFNESLNSNSSSNNSNSSNSNNGSLNNNSDYTDGSNEDSTQDLIFPLTEIDQSGSNLNNITNQIPHLSNPDKSHIDKIIDFGKNDLESVLDQLDKMDKVFNNSTNAATKIDELITKVNKLYISSGDVHLDIESLKINNIQSIIEELNSKLIKLHGFICSIKDILCKLVNMKDFLFKAFSELTKIMDNINSVIDKLSSIITSIDDTINNALDKFNELIIKFNTDSMMNKLDEIKNDIIDAIGLDKFYTIEREIIGILKSCPITNGVSDLMNEVFEKLIIDKFRDFDSKIQGSLGLSDLLEGCVRSEFSSSSNINLGKLDIPNFSLNIPELSLSIGRC